MQIFDCAADDGLCAEVDLVIEGDEEPGAKGVQGSPDARGEGHPVDYVDRAGDHGQEQQSAAPFATALELPDCFGLAQGCRGGRTQRLEGSMCLYRACMVWPPCTG